MCSNMVYEQVYIHEDIFYSNCVLCNLVVQETSTHTHIYIYRLFMKYNNTKSRAKFMTRCA